MNVTVALTSVSPRVVPASDGALAAFTAALAHPDGRRTGHNVLAGLSVGALEALDLKYASGEDFAEPTLRALCVVADTELKQAIREDRVRPVLMRLIGQDDLGSLDWALAEGWGTDGPFAFEVEAVDPPSSSTKTARLATTG